MLRKRGGRRLWKCISLSDSLKIRSYKLGFKLMLSFEGNLKQEELESMKSEVV